MTRNERMTYNLVTLVVELLEEIMPS